MRHLGFELTLSVLLGSMSAAACGPTEGDDQPAIPSAGTTDEAPPDACTEQWEAFVASDPCTPSFPFTPRLEVDVEGSVLVLDDPEDATPIGPSGWFLENTGSAEWIGYHVHGDASCRMGCFAPSDQFCPNEDGSLCTSVVDGRLEGCLYCGPATLAECQDFLGSCPSNEEGDGGADSTGG